ncbi:MAG: hypothetical protein GEU81_06020 [Nitriliruptorales bacterium]|nr:hypothetical protein [Nitriliruptorales bacterium]
MLASLLGLALLAAACGGGADDDAAATSEPADAAATEEEEAATEADAAATEEEELDQAEAPNPLEGELISLVVGVGPGGGYDQYARIIAPFLAEELDADVVVENIPGAGGLVALNGLLADPPDGTHLMLINGSGIGGSALAGAEGVEFELEELAYVARVYAGAKVVATGASSGYESFQDLIDTDETFSFGSSGPGASTYVEPTVLMEMLGLNATIITGFEGSADINAFMIAGDVDGILVDIDSQLALFDSGDTMPLLLLAEERDDDIPDTPTLMELDLDEEQEVIASALLALLDLGRTVVAHPDTPEDVLEALRGAFDNILASPGLQEASEEQNRPLEPLTGAEVEGVVSTILDAPPEFLQMLEQGY